MSILLRLSGTLILCVAAAIGQTSYTISTVAGNGTAGYAGDGAAATSAELNLPFACVVNAGNLYIADQGNYRVRYVAASNGNITTAAGNGILGNTGDGSAAGSAEIGNPSGVAVDSGGNLYIADTINHLIRKVTPSGTISTYAGNVTASQGGTLFSGDNGAATNATLFKPSGLAIDSSGNLYIADTGNNAIRKITASNGIITTIAGNTNPGYTGDNGPAKNARLNNPTAVAVDTSGNVYIADTANHVIRKVTASGTITTVAGNGTGGFSGDGNKAFPLAQLNDPKGVAVDSAGNVYISDTNNHRIRVVSASGIINTIAGNGRNGYSGDGGSALSAQINFPAGLWLASSGNLYVADNHNNVIRLLTLSGGGTGGQKPAISANGIVSAGQFGAFGSVAPGSWIEIYGTNLAADTRSWATADFTNNGQSAPVSLDRTEVTVANQAAVVDYISPGQVNVQVPFVPQGQQQVTVSTAAGTSTTYSLNIDPNKFGVYAPSQFTVGGKQYVGALFTDNTTYVLPPNSVSGFTSRQAHPGETIVIYGVGFGPVTNNVLPGQIAQGLTALSGSVQVLFGSTPAVVSYAGLAPQSFGLYQLNVVVPAIASNDAVPVTISLNGVAGSQTLYTAVQ